MSRLQDFLEGKAQESRARAGYERRCSICRNEELASEVREYAEGARDGKIAFSVWKIWKEYFRPVWGVSSHQTIETHIEHHLGIRLR